MRFLGLLTTIILFGSSAIAEEYPGVYPPLTEAQQVQLDAADDTRPPDEPAWYGLLTNVSSWDPRTLGADAWVDDSEQTAAHPVWDSLLENPQTYRGQVFLLEGRFAGRQRRVEVLRAGPWGSALTEWGVVTDTGEVAVVYFVDPQEQLTPPREGERVRTAGRFYKLWLDVDGQGQPATYPVFVGRSAQVFGTTTTGQGVFEGVVIAGIVAMLAALLWVKRFGRRAPPGVTARRALDRRGRQEALPEAAHKLPEDPAEALAELEQQAGSSTDRR